MLVETVSWLDERAARYGGTAADILDKTPTYLWDNPEELRAFWDDHDLSHIFPQSVYPELANDWTNIIAEDSTVNRQRGAEVMSHSEIVDADLQSEMIALDIDGTHFGDSTTFAGELMETVFF